MKTQVEEHNGINAQATSKFVGIPPDYKRCAGKALTLKENLIHFPPAHPLLATLPTHVVVVCDCCVVVDDILPMSRPLI